MSGLPSQLIPEIEKTHDWGKLCVQYGCSLLDIRDKERKSDTDLYRSYNGDRTEESIQWITKNYGKESKAQFHSYKVGRSKQYLLEGEYLRRPLNVVVQTVNRQAKSEKMAHMDLMVGAMLAKDEIQALKQTVGIDVMNGAPIPQDEDDPLWEKMSPKDRQEEIMQIIINEKVKSERLLYTFGENFKDARITAKCFGKVFIDEKGESRYKWIDVRDAVYEEIIGDPFLEKSTIKGAREWLPLHEVLLRHKLSPEDAKKVENGTTSPTDRLRHKTQHNQNMIEVVHVEWKSVRKRYYKIMPKTPDQLAYDSETTEIRKEIPPEVYEKQKDKYDKGVSKGEFKIETGWREDLWEGTSIGRVVFTDIRRKPNQLRRYDSPAYILDSSYVGCLFGTTDGVRVSLQNLIEKFDLQYDICEYQIMKELVRAKGKVIGFDLSTIPKGKDLPKLVQEMVDDQLLTYNSMAAGNLGNRNLTLHNMIQEFDLGFSKSFPDLLRLQSQILGNLDRITGINDSREGASPASATVANTQQALQNSRTITEPLFYQMQLFVENVMTRLVCATKISWAHYKLEKGEEILGTDKFKYMQGYMQVSKDIGLRDYGVHIEDGSRYSRLKEKLDRYMEYGINSKQVSMVDALRYELSETTVEAEKALAEGFERLQQISTQIAREQQAADAKAQAEKLQTQVQLNREQREDTQQHDLTKIAAQTQGQIQIDSNKIKGKLVETQLKNENDLLSE